MSDYVEGIACDWRIYMSEDGTETSLVTTTFGVPDDTDGKPMRPIHTIRDRIYNEALAIQARALGWSQ